MSDLNGLVCKGISLDAEDPFYFIYGEELDYFDEHEMADEPDDGWGTGSAGAIANCRADYDLTFDDGQ